MTFRAYDTIGAALDQTTTAQLFPLGTIVEGIDPVYGVGEFIYLKGVASTAVGDVVTYNVSNTSGTPDYTTTRAAATANTGQPIAIAMSANVASQYGWYQSSGTAIANSNGTISGAGASVFVVATANVSTTAVAGKQILNAITASANSVPTTNKVLLNIQRPFTQGQIT